MKQVMLGTALALALAAAAYAHDLAEQVCWTDSDGNYQCETIPISHEHPTSFGVRG